MLGKAASPFIFINQPDTNIAKMMFRSLSILSLLHYSSSTLTVTVVPLTLTLPKPYKSDVAPAVSEYD
jgi:hypothetical protein